jgi:hypothetical protein
MARIGERLRGKILDLTDPGWRDRPLMANVLANQRRIRSDPNIQAMRRRVHKESMRLVHAVSACSLLAPVIGWSAYALATDKPWSLALNTTPVALYGAWAIGVVLLYAVIARD